MIDFVYFGSFILSPEIMFIFPNRSMQTMMMTALWSVVMMENTRMVLRLMLGPVLWPSWNDTLPMVAGR